MTINGHLIEPGVTLPNGAIAIASHPADFRGDGIVLAVIPGNDVTPYVTWRFVLGGVDTFWGNYHRTFDEAIEDFNTRR